MIRVEIGTLADRGEEAVLRPIRSDLAPMTSGSRDVALAAGEEVDARLQAVGRIPVGGAVITPGGDLTARYVIHVVTCAEDEPQTPLTVQRGVKNGLRRAADMGIDSLALPPIGIAAGTMDAEDQARALVELLVDHIAEGVPPLDLVVVVPGAYEEQIFLELVSELASAARDPRDDENPH